MSQSSLKWPIAVGVPMIIAFVVLEQLQDTALNFVLVMAATLVVIFLLAILLGLIRTGFTKGASLENQEIEEISTIDTLLGSLRKLAMSSGEDIQRIYPSVSDAVREFTGLLSTDKEFTPDIAREARLIIESLVDQFKETQRLYPDPEHPIYQKIHLSLRKVESGIRGMSDLYRQGKTVTIVGRLQALNNEIGARGYNQSSDKGESK